VTDRVVGRCHQLWVELQSEDTGVWQWIAVMLPLLAPLTTAKNRTLLVGHVRQRIPKDLVRFSPEVQAGSRKRIREAELGPQWPCRSSVGGCGASLYVILHLPVSAYVLMVVLQCLQLTVRRTSYVRQIDQRNAPPHFVPSLTYSLNAPRLASHNTC
jgi:hypothetical protein